jgi:hypothetical protein
VGRAAEDRPLVHHDAALHAGSRPQWRVSLMASKRTPREQFDPAAVKRMKQLQAIGQQEGAADRNQGRRTRMSLDGSNRIKH